MTLRPFLYRIVPATLFGLSILPFNKAVADVNSGTINFTGPSQAFQLDIGTNLQITADAFIHAEYGTPPFGAPDVTVNVTVPEQTFTPTFQSGATSASFFSVPTGSADVTFEDFDQGSGTPLPKFPGGGVTQPSISNTNINIGSFFLDLAPLQASGTANVIGINFNLDLEISLDPTVTFTFNQTIQPAPMGTISGIPGELIANIQGDVRASATLDAGFLGNFDVVNNQVLTSLNENIVISLDDVGDLLPGLPTINNFTQNGTPTPGNRVPASFEFGIDLGQLGIGAIPVDINEDLSLIQDNPDVNPGSGDFDIEDIFLNANISGSIDIEDIAYALDSTLNDAIQSAEAPIAEANGGYQFSISDLSEMLSAAGSTDPEGQSLTHEWLVDGLNSIGNGSTQLIDFLTTGIANPQDTAFIELLVTDPTLQTDSDTATLSYLNSLPVINEILAQQLGHDFEFDLDLLDPDMALNGLIPGFEQMMFEIDLAEALDASDIGDGFIVDQTTTIIDLETLIAILGGIGQHTIWLNVVDSSGTVVSQQFSITVPEPNSMILLGFATVGMAGWQLRRSRKKAANS